MNPVMIVNGALEEVPIGLGFDRADGAVIYQDFCHNSAIKDFSATNNGTAAAASLASGEANHPGIVQLSTGSTNAGRSQLHTPINTLILGGGEITFEVLFKIPTLSVTAQTFWIRAGLMDYTGGSGEPTNGVYIRNKHDVNSGEFEFVCRSGGVETGSVIDSNTAATTSWTKAGFVINAGATSVQFKINGSNVGSPITGNIPSAALGVVAGLIAKTAGTTARTLLIDYCYLGQTFSSAR